MQHLMDFALRSDVGRKRRHNEDSSLVAPELGLALVADGMGGYKAGEVASAIAVYRVLEEMKPFLGEQHPEMIDQESGFTRASVAVRNAIVQANEEIFDKAEGIPQCNGMGTTVVAAMFYAGRVTLAHVGDSRAYRMRNGELRAVTNDHSLVQEMVDRGLVSAEEAAENTPRNLVTRALGVERTVRVEITQDHFESGDLFLLCSDGLNDMVSDKEIGLTLSKYSANLAEAAERLVALANERGGKDNVSVVLLRPQPADGNTKKGLLAGLSGRRTKARK